MQAINFRVFKDMLTKELYGEGHTHAHTHTHTHTHTVNCGDPGVPDNAVRDGNSFLYNDVVIFTCNNGYYQSSGPVGGVRRCLETGLWSEEQPICSRTLHSDTCNMVSVKT